MVKWIPHDCVGGTCLIEAPGVGFPPAVFSRKCLRHGIMGLNDELLHRVIVLSSRRRERARWEAKLELGLPKDELVDYRVNTDGSITLLTKSSSVVRTAILNRINVALAGMENAPGVSMVTVE